MVDFQINRPNRQISETESRLRESLGARVPLTKSRDEGPGIKFSYRVDVPRIQFLKKNFKLSSLDFVPGKRAPRDSRILAYALLF